MISQVLRLLTIATLAFVAISFMPTYGQAQVVGGDTGGFGGDLGGGDLGGGDLGGGDVGGGDVGGGTPIIGGDLGDTGGGGGGTAEAPDLSDLINIEAEIPVLEDRRRVGFVGPTNELGTAVGDAAPPTGFVGANSEPFAAGGGATGNAGRTGGRTGAGGQRAGAGQQNGFVVTRQNLRTRMRPAFQTITIGGDFVSTRFQNRLQRQPSTSSFGRNVQVNVQDRVAVLTGFVQSPDEADRIVRHLRLEPGVYRIDNRLSVGN